MDVQFFLHIVGFGLLTCVGYFVSMKMQDTGLQFSFLIMPLPCFVMLAS